MPPIPWASILTHGPAIVGAAKRLLATSQHEKDQAIEVRLDQLEKASAESARLLQEIAQQVETLTIAHRQTAQRALIAIIIGVAAAVVGIGAAILAVIW
jgi:hypothetical protein